MTLSRMVAAWILLVALTGLIPSAYAQTNLNVSKSNTVMLSCTNPSGGPMTGSYAITFTRDGAALHFNPVVDMCAFSKEPCSLPACHACAPPTCVGSLNLLRTDQPANGFKMAIQMTLGNVPTTCNDNMAKIDPNTPIQIVCKADNASDLFKGATVTVTITTNVPE